MNVNELIDDVGNRIRNTIVEFPNENIFAEGVVVIGEYDCIYTQIGGIPYIYCPTIVGFKLGNCTNIKACRFFEDINDTGAWEKHTNE